MYTDFDLDRLRFAGLISERLIFWPKKSIQYRLSTYNHVHTHTRTLYTREAVHLCELYLLIYNTCKCIFLLLVDLVDKVVISVSMT